MDAGSNGGERGEGGGEHQQEPCRRGRVAPGNLFVTNRRPLITYGVYVRDHVFTYLLDAAKSAGRVESGDHTTGLYCTVTEPY